MVVLSDAWGRMVDTCHARMNFEPPQTERVGDMIDFVQRRLDIYLEEGDQFAVELDLVVAEVNEQMSRYASEEDFSELAIRRAVARFEACLDRLFDNFDDLSRVKPNFLNAKGWTILRDAYRGTLLSIQESLEDGEELLADPIAYNTSRGIPNSDPPTYTIELDANPIPQAELEALYAWASDPSVNTPPWAIVAFIALSLGVLIFLIWLLINYQGLMFFLVACVVVGMYIAAPFARR